MNELLVALVKPVDDAVSVHVPAVSERGSQKQPSVNRENASLTGPRETQCIDGVDGHRASGWERSRPDGGNTHRCAPELVTTFQRHLNLHQLAQRGSGRHAYCCPEAFSEATGTAR